MPFKYLVTTTGDGTARLIEAKSPTSAIAHCAKDAFTAERVSDSVASLLKIPVEQAKADTVAELELPEPEAPKATKGKPAAE